MNGKESLKMLVDKAGINEKIEVLHSGIISRLVKILSNVSALLATQTDTFATESLSRAEPIEIAQQLTDALILKIHRFMLNWWTYK